MIQPMNMNRAAWVNCAPPSRRDIRKLNANFPILVDSEKERDTRISILEKGGTSSGAIAAILRDARAREPAPIGCCPLLARRFQIWFVDGALYLHSRLNAGWRGRGTPFTLLDLSEAVDAGQLHTIDWRRLHARLRKRITRILGQQVVVIGMGEVEWDPSRLKWQPHYHVMIYDVDLAKLKTFRKKHYSAKRRGARPMVKSDCGEPATWFSYMSKLVVFGKVAETGGGVRRVRLSNPLSREYFRYLAARSPTSFMICINCSLLDRKVTNLDEEERSYLGDPDGSSWGSKNASAR